MYLELMKTGRSSQWSGILLNDVPGILLGFLIYLVVLMVLTHGWLRVFSLGFTIRSSTLLALVLFSMLAAASVWGLLSPFRETAPTRDDYLVVASIVVLGGGLMTVAGFYLRRFNYVLNLATAAVLSASAAVFAVGQICLYHPQRVECITFLPALWVALVCIAGLTLFQAHHLIGALLQKAILPIAIIIPPAFSCFMTTAPVRPVTEERPNLVLIIADTLRADLLAPHGGAVPAPHLEQFAQRGTFFEQSYALAPWTMPSMSALFSSSYPPGLTPGGSREDWVSQLWQYEAHTDSRSLAEKLQEKGYVTGAFTANALLPVLPGMLNGFEMHASAHPILLREDGVLEHCPFLRDTIKTLLPGVIETRPHDTTEDMTQYARSFLKRYRNKPFFMWVHYIDPHAPYDPPKRYRPADGPWPLFHPYKGGERWGIPQLGPDFDIQPENRPYVQRLYEGETCYIDDHLGILLQTLRDLGLEESTTVCFTSDHGEAFWEHDKWGHGQSVYEPLVHVPLVLAGSDINAQRIEAPVSAIHLIPTLADLMGLEAEPGWRGKSLVPVLDGTQPTPPDEPIFAQGTSDKASQPLQMVRKGDWKLIRNAETDAVALYHLKEDPREQQDVSEENPERTRELRQELENWLQSFPSTFTTPEKEDSMGQEMIEQLRGMGYF